MVMVLQVTVVVLQVKAMVVTSNSYLLQAPSPRKPDTSKCGGKAPATDFSKN
jgi:hypothetical protein